MVNKDVQIYIYYVKKRTCLGIVSERGRGDENETSLKEGRKL